MSGRIAVVEGELADQAVDAVMVAAGGAGEVDAGEEDSPLAAAAGPAFREERAALGAIPVGGATATGGGALPARRVIHLGVAEAGRPPNLEGVRTAVRRGLELAGEHGCRTVALPALGASREGLPLRELAEGLLEEAEAYLSGDPPRTSPAPLEEIRFVLAGEQAYRTFESVWDARKIAAQMERMARMKRR